MALERISFKKPIVPEPRLSTPYVPGKHHSRFWTEDEKQVLKDHFPTKGAQYCRGLLPNRKTHAIYTMAHKLGLRCSVRIKPRTEHKKSPELDQQIRDEWVNMTGRKKGEVKALADKLDVPRWWLSKRALVLGLVIPRVTKEPPWTEAELDLLKRTPLHDPEKAAEVFREHGYPRTPAAIMVKAKRQGISRRYKETLSATACAKILGVDGKNFTTWILKGIVKATKRETKRLPQQGGHPWSLDRADFRQFIIDNIERIDIRKVDKFAFVEILTGGGNEQATSEAIENQGGAGRIAPAEPKEGSAASS